MLTVEALANNDETSAIMTKTYNDRENEGKLYESKESRELASRMPVISRLWRIAVWLLTRNCHYLRI